jgi:hypothetical protein
MAQREKEFGAISELSNKSFAEQVAQNKKQYELAQQTLQSQIDQYRQSSETQREQFGQQMAYQMADSAQKARESEKNYNLVLSQYGSQLFTARQPFPDVFAPAGWNSQAYLAANPDVATDPYFKTDPLGHYWTSGKSQGRTW